DGRAGVVFVAIDTSADPAFYVAGEDYDVMFTAGTVDGNDMARVFVRMFSLENRSRKANVVQIAGQTANAAAAVTFPASVANESTVGTRATQTSVDAIASYVDTEVAAIKAKTDNLPASPASVADIPTASQNRDAVLNAMPDAGYADGSIGDRILLSDNNNRTVKVTGAGSGHIGADVHVMQTDVITDAAVSAAAVTKIQSGLATSTALAAVALNVTALVTRIPSTLFSGITYMSRWLGAIAGKTADSTTRAEINLTPAGAGYNETTDSLEAIRDRGDAAWTSGGGAGGVTNITVEDRSITLD
ncbi:MAG: hypothetical protein ACK5XN_22375, partial [Bacteroidota bacterium]